MSDWTPPPRPRSPDPAYVFVLAVVWLVLAVTAGFLIEADLTIVVGFVVTWCGGVASTLLVLELQHRREARA